MVCVLHLSKEEQKEIQRIKESVWESGSSFVSEEKKIQSFR